jgi:hypothetical protein
MTGLFRPQKRLTVIQRVFYISEKIGTPLHRDIPIVGKSKSQKNNNQNDSIVVSSLYLFYT